MGPRRHEGSTITTVQKGPVLTPPNRSRPTLVVGQLLRPDRLFLMAGRVPSINGMGSRVPRYMVVPPLLSSVQLLSLPLP